MNPREIKARLYDAFAKGCEARHGRILAALDAFGAGEIEARAALERIAVELHDHIGDAKMISLDKVSEAAVELEHLVHLWKDRLLPTNSPEQLDESIKRVVASETFRKWLERLVYLSRRYALEVGDSGQVRDLQNLRLEFAKAVELETRPKRTSRGTRPLPKLNQRRILLLDDSDISRSVLAAALEEMGHVVHAAGNAEEFWELLGAVRPEVVFLDVNMPDIKGDEVCRLLRQREDSREVPVVIFSSLPDEELEVLAQEAGASGYVSKQHGIDTLNHYLERLVAGGVL